MDNLYNQMARRRRRGETGFTLIELLVVIAVLAILAAIVIFNVVGVGQRGQTSACKTDLQTLQTAVDAYYNDGHGAGNAQVYPVTGTDTATPTAGTSTVNTAELVSGGYVHTVPTSTGTLTYQSNGTITAANC